MKKGTTTKPMGTLAADAARSSGAESARDMPRPPLPGGLPRVVAGTHRQILVVDDEKVIRTFARDFLERIGYTVWLAEDGREAVRIMTETEGRFDLILMDLMMPKMDGRETFYAIRNRYPAARILLTSGYADNTVTRELLDAGAVDFLAKPFDALDLTTAIQRALAPAGAAD